MQRYEPATRRVAFGIAAVGMTAVTIGVLVVVPAIVGLSPNNQLIGPDTVTTASAQAIMDAPAVVDPASKPAAAKEACRNGQGSLHSDHSSSQSCSRHHDNQRRS